MLRLLRKVSLPQLSASWGRTALIVGGIATGVSLIVAIGIINTSVVRSIRRTIELIAGPAALEVVLGVGEVGFDQRAADIVRADPDVAAAIPLVRGTITLADDPAETLQLFGADFTAEEDLQRYPVVANTDRRELLRAIGDPRAILVTTVFARRHRLATGAGIRLSTPQGVSELIVRGLLETEGLAAAVGGQLAVMDLPAAQLLLGKEDRVDQVDVVLRDGADVNAVRRRLEDALPHVLTVAPPAQRAAQYDAVLASFQSMLSGISTLCLVAGMFLVYNTTSTGAVHRAWTLASLRVLGADADAVFRLLILEALVLGAVGTALGVGAGIVLGRLLLPMVTDSMGINFQLRFHTHEMHLNARQLLVAAAVGISTAVGASWFAARRASRAHPIAALGADLGTMLSHRPPRRLVWWWVVLVAFSAIALLLQARFKSVSWGNVGATLWNASVVVIAIPMAHWLARALTRSLRVLSPVPGRIAAESLFRSTVRTGTTTAAIALALSVAITMSSLPYSFRESVRSYVAKFLSADLIVSAVATEGGWLECPIPESVATEISAIPGVRTVDFGRVLTGQPFRERRIGVLAASDGWLDPARLPKGWYREGDPDAAATAIRAGEAVDVSTTLADHHGLHVGDRIELQTPTGNLSLPIAGVVPDYVSDHGTVILSRRIFVERWGDRSLSRITVFADSTVPLDELRRRITEHFHDRYRLKVLSVGEVVAYHDRMINRAFAFTDAIQLLIAIVTVCGIFDVLVSTILERRRELAVWRVIGADERVVRGSVVLAAGTIGALGVALGLAVGLVTALLWIKLNLRYLLGYDLEYHFPGRPMMLSVVLVALMTLAAGYVAARGATRQSILDGIRSE